MASCFHRQLPATIAGGQDEFVLIVTVVGFAIPGVLVWLVRFSFYLIELGWDCSAQGNFRHDDVPLEFVQPGFSLAIFPQGSDRYLLIPSKLWLSDSWKSDYLSDSLK